MLRRRLSTRRASLNQQGYKSTALVFALVEVGAVVVLVVLDYFTCEMEHLARQGETATGDQTFDQMLTRTHVHTTTSTYSNTCTYYFNFTDSYA